jgi:leucyl aminopeptidase
MLPEIRSSSELSLLGQASLMVRVVQCPFDRAADDLGMPVGVGERLVAEARRMAFKGDMGQCIYTHADDGTRWWALVGAGANPRATQYRRVGAAVTRLARTLRTESAQVWGSLSEERSRFLTEGIALAGYSFDRYRTDPDHKSRPILREAVVFGDEAVAQGVALGGSLATSVALARDVANEHPGRCTPRYLAEVAADIAQRAGMTLHVFDEQAIRDKGFGLLEAVGRGSAEPPRLIHATWKGAGEIRRRLCIVGKGITYDSGGYSMKPAANQLGMHLDMGGSAAVLGAMEAVAHLRPEHVEVHFLIPAAENLVSSRAYKLNEIVRSYSGRTVEILNTDAEGRLVLADALSYACTLEPDAIVDLATLTGACVVALGEDTAGFFCNDETLADTLGGAARNVDESLWRMPLTERLESALHSDVADMKNIGGKTAGAITAALFLKRFVGEIPWAHLDIAGTAMTEVEWEYINKGGTGFGVLTLAEWICRPA